MSYSQQSQSLTALRDALLPKLLSGEVRVKAEKMDLHGRTRSKQRRTP